MIKIHNNIVGLSYNYKCVGEIVKISLSHYNKGDLYAAKAFAWPIIQATGRMA